MANLVLAFGEVLVGAVLLDAAVKGDSIPNVIKGVATQQPFPGSSATATAAATGGSSSSTGPIAAGTYTNPVPGAATGRIDQGVDYTGNEFLAPGASKVLVSNPADAGWGGGGYVSAQLLDGPLKGAVYYFAEGIAPFVQAGQTIAAGTVLGQAVANPYNGTRGNIEAGWANSTGTAPLAQSLSGYAGDQSTPGLTAGYSFSTFVHSLGGVAGTFEGAGSALASTIEHEFAGGATPAGVPYG